MSTTAVREVETPSATPRALIVSLFGLYARELGGWLSVATIVRLMADLGVDEQATRSAVFRLKKRGWLDAEKDGRSAGYRASPEALAILAEGDERIFGRRRATADDGWLLVVFSVPESERDKRHRLRSTLARLGLGTVGPGTWVAPGHLDEAVLGALDRGGLRQFTDVFRADHLSSAPPRDTIAAWWDLDALQTTYADYLGRFSAVADRWPDEPDVPDEARAFADYVPAVTAWRRLPYLDPGLPLDALPEDWIGLRAEVLFARFREHLAAPAAAHVRAVVRG
ncbi:PaaX family transcriptional regulator [Actinomycetospora lemnae]|uniref:PaaX family transcriptional regulator C-terminal domain-containing protein n=1 Tax=Actinomycetospora lemnae TaxID=3019891 RepID=A0ABT5T2Y7_9PSEU|nr:PaaX family transcriptional regulator C-terminal domain-containing protein [Actinomycetospora sp. DW7H6]MDD7969336.1 PaaX family transcriptional regulator C-terminal domain-containing protein [Actinomycetospora sp. DW7H6]